MEWISAILFFVLTAILIVAGAGAALGWWWSGKPSTEGQVPLFEYFGLDEK